MFIPRIQRGFLTHQSFDQTALFDDAVRVCRDRYNKNDHAALVIDLETRTPIYLWKRDADVNKVLQGYYGFGGKRYHVREGDYVLFVQTGSDYHDRVTIARINKETGRITHETSRHAKLVASAILADPYSRQCEYGTITGTCARCGRKLEDPTSRSIGMGPVCRGKF